MLDPASILTLGGSAPSLRLGLSAMATRFELVLPGTHHARLRAAGEAALQEVENVEAWLSVHRLNTPLSTINSIGYRQPVQVPPPVFDLLVRARELTRSTHGCFDPTVGPWIDAGPTSGETSVNQGLLSAVGWRNVELDADRGVVRLHHPRARIDLGGLGKGYALDRAVATLKESGIESAFLHGGTSSVWALGTPAEDDFWRIDLGAPPRELAPHGSPGAWVRHLKLRDTSLSVSATWGRFRPTGDAVWQGHILDPVCGKPVPGLHRAAALCPSATDAEALSTGMLVAGPVGFAAWKQTFPDAELIYD